MAINRKTANYPIGSVSHGTMREEDLIPTFLTELEYQLKHGPSVSRATRKAHYELLRAKVDDQSYWESDEPGYDLEVLFDALNEYAGPYFYFGTHPGDGSDYGYWLSEGFDDEFVSVAEWEDEYPTAKGNCCFTLKVMDSADIPPRYRGEVLIVTDHGNMTLAVKTSRSLRIVWEVV